MSARETYTHAQTTPVKVVTGCLSCGHYHETQEYLSDSKCTHPRKPGWENTLPSSYWLRLKGDTPPDWCPLPKLGDTVEVRPA